MARTMDFGPPLLTLRRSPETAGAAFQAFETVRAIVDEKLSTLATSFNSGAPAMSLPLDLISEVVLSLDLTTDRLAASGVCREWREHLLHDSRIWQPLKWTFGGATIRQEAENMQRFKDNQIRSLRGSNTVALECRVTTGTLPLNMSSAELPLDRVHGLTLELFARRFGFTISPFPNVTSLRMQGRYDWPQLTAYLLVNLNTLFPMLRFLVVDTDFAQFGEQFVPAICHGLAVCVMYGPVLDNRTWRILRTAYPNVYRMSVTVDYIGAVEFVPTEKEVREVLDMKGLGSQEVLNFEPFAHIAHVSIDFDVEHWTAPPWRLLEQVLHPHSVTVQWLRNWDDPEAREILLVMVKDSSSFRRVRDVVLRGAVSDHSVAHMVTDALIAHVVSGVRVLSLDLCFAEAILCKTCSTYGSVTTLDLIIDQPAGGVTVWASPDDALVVLPSLVNVRLSTSAQDRIPVPVADIKRILQRLRASEDPKPCLILDDPVYLDDAYFPEFQDFITSILSESPRGDEVLWIQPDRGAVVPGI